MILNLSLANRDPSVFLKPDVFDPMRKNVTDHLSFGLGSHHCTARRFASRLASSVVELLLENREGQLK